MSDGTKIEWTDATWNPITGCSVVSPGCTNCYAMKLAGTRLQHHPSRAGLTRETKAGPVWNGTLRFNEEWLTQPLRWNRPRMVFVCAHGDLFHEDVPDEWIDKVFAVMALAPQHTFQVLTKRAARMRAYLSRHRWHLWAAAGRAIDPLRWQNLPPIMGGDCTPLPNVWLGVSAEDQARADERVPELLATPAAVRFVSAEPLLGPIDFTRHLWPVHGWWKGPYNSYSEAKAAGAECGLKRQALVGAWCRFLDWIIVGGENGPREMRAEWAQQIRDQCAAAGTAFFFKQWGSHIPAGQTMPNGKVWAPGCGTRLRATKAITGRLLDGVEHNAMPRAA
jgi:protein gp37